MKNSTIAWTHHTFNAWRGCQKVSPGCQFCYAEKLSKRNPKVLGEWGPDGRRVVAAEAAWREPLVWDRDAAAAGERHRVFSLSLGDVFEDRPELAAPRARLFEQIRRTAHLDWLVLTKRPENSQAMLPWRGDVPWPNVWLGVSVEDQKRAEERLPLLAAAPARVRFASCEPLLGLLDLSPWLAGGGLDWVIVGGETGGAAQRRTMDLAWLQALVGSVRRRPSRCS